MSDVLAEVLTLDEAAELAGRAPVTLRRAAVLGRLAARRIGAGGQRAVWITTREAVAEYLAYVARAGWAHQPQAQRRPGGHPRRRPRAGRRR